MAKRRRGGTLRQGAAPSGAVDLARLMSWSICSASQLACVGVRGGLGILLLQWLFRWGISGRLRLGGVRLRGDWRFGLGRNQGLVRLGGLRRHTRPALQVEPNHACQAVAVRLGLIGAVRHRHARQLLHGTGGGALRSALALCTRLRHNICPAHPDDDTTDPALAWQPSGPGTQPSLHWLHWQPGGSARLTQLSGRSPAHSCFCTDKKEGAAGSREASLALRLAGRQGGGARDRSERQAPACQVSTGATPPNSCLAAVWPGDPAVVALRALAAWRVGPIEAVGREAFLALWLLHEGGAGMMCRCRHVSAHAAPAQRRCLNARTWQEPSGCGAPNPGLHCVQAQAGKSLRAAQLGGRSPSHSCFCVGGQGGARQARVGTRARRPRRRLQTTPTGLPCTPPGRRLCSWAGTVHTRSLGDLPAARSCLACWGTGRAAAGRARGMQRRAGQRLPRR